MQLYDAADVTGDGAIHTISSALGGLKYAKWFQVQAVSVGAVAVRVGSASITATRGAVVGPGGSQFAPTVAEMTNFYDLTKIYYLAQVGDQVSILCGA